MMEACVEAIGKLGHVHDLRVVDTDMCIMYIMYINGTDSEIGML